MTNEDYDTVSFAGQAERAVFRPDRGSDPTMSPAGGGYGMIFFAIATQSHARAYAGVPCRDVISCVHYRFAKFEFITTG